ncbi:hypothetical protein ES703_78639 [subsurface metagenome]
MCFQVSLSLMAEVLTAVGEVSWEMELRPLSSTISSPRIGQYLMPFPLLVLVVAFMIVMASSSIIRLHKIMPQAMKELPEAVVSTDVMALSNIISSRTIQ